MVRHPDDTRELCQDTFLRVHRYLHQYRFESALKTWIGQVAYSVARRHLARKRLPIAEPAADEDPSALVERVADDFDLEAAIAEIARITGLAAGTIKSHLFRCRARLRGRLQARLGAME
jgi:RNA polymerase sigma-70 factor (ECF subfamily)